MDFREQNEAEKEGKKGGFTDIMKKGRKTYKQQVLAIIDEKIQHYHHKMKIPYAKIRALNTVEDRMTELKRLKLHSEKDFDAGTVKIDIDFDKFAGEKFFHFIGEKEVVQQITKDGVKQNSAIGVYREFVDKETGEKISIQVLHHEKVDDSKSDNKKSEPNKIVEPPVTPPVNK